MVNWLTKQPMLDVPLKPTVKVRPKKEMLVLFNLCKKQYTSIGYCSYICLNKLHTLMKILLANHKTKSYSNRWLYVRVVLRKCTERSKFMIKFLLNAKSKKIQCRHILATNQNCSEYRTDLQHFLATGNEF